MRFLVMIMTVQQSLVDGRLRACADDILRLQAQSRQHTNQGDRKTYGKALKEAQRIRE